MKEDVKNYYYTPKTAVRKMKFEGALCYSSPGGLSDLDDYTDGGDPFNTMNP